MGYFFGYREYDRRKAAGETPSHGVPVRSRLELLHLHVLEPGGAVHEPTRQRRPSSTSPSTSRTPPPSDGDEVAMLFVKPPPKPDGIKGDRPVKELKSFAKITVKADMTATAHLPLRIRDLRRWEGNENGSWVIDSGAYTILVGKDADDAETSPTMRHVDDQGRLSRWRISTHPAERIGIGIGIKKHDFSTKSLWARRSPVYWFALLELRNAPALAQDDRSGPAP